MPPTRPHYAPQSALLSPTVLFYNECNVHGDAPITIGAPAATLNNCEFRLVQPPKDSLTFLLRTELLLYIASQEKPHIPPGSPLRRGVCVLGDLILDVLEYMFYYNPIGARCWQAPPLPALA